MQLDPAAYTTAIAVAAVAAWYRQNASGWEEIAYGPGTPCVGSTSFVMPNGCAMRRACEKHVYVFGGAASSTTWILGYTRR